MTDRELVEAALKARPAAYAPYSHCLVGAALLCADGTVYTGCNVENASYGATLCAERNAFAAAVADGKRAFTAMAVAGGVGETIDGGFPPCGICRQVMAEFANAEFTVLVATSPEAFTAYRLGDLLPAAFSL